MSRYAQAAATVPEPCFVLGTPLRPFCLGFHLLFKRQGNPFCGSPSATVTDEEFIVAVALCGQTYDETLEQFLTGRWQREFKQWRGQLTGGVFRRRRLTKAVLDEGKMLFRAYLSDGYSKPPVWKNLVAGGLTISTPWELTLKNRLVMAGYSELEVLNGYLPGRWYDYYAVSELNAAANCVDEKKWRRVFYTQEDHERFGRKPVEVADDDQEETE